MCIPDPTRIVLATRQRLYSLFLFPPLPPTPTHFFPLPLSLTLLPVGTFVLCFIIWPLHPLSLHVSLSLSFSILFGSVHFSLECLSSQLPLCSGLPLLNTNKTRTTQVEQGARAQRDKRLTRHSITTAVNCPLLTLRRLPGTVAQLGSRETCCPATGWDGGNQRESGHQPPLGQRPFQRCHLGLWYLMSVFHSPVGPCSLRGPRDLLENGGCAARGCELPS